MDNLELIKDKIIIGKDEYNEFLMTGKSYLVLVNAIYEGARLDFTKNDLTFDDTYIKPILKVLDNENYSRKLNELKREAKEND